MKLLISLIIFISIPLYASNKNISYAEKKVIKSFVAKVNPTLLAADGCLQELININKPGIQCESYHKKIDEVNQLYRKVNLIDKKKRNHAIANNNEWYNAFLSYDKLQFIVLRINKI